MLQTRNVTTDDPGFGDFFAEHNERFVRACVLLTGRVIEGEDWPRSRWRGSWNGGIASPGWMTLRGTCIGRP